MGMLALGAAVLALGCGGGSEDDTTSDRGPAAAGATGGPGKQDGPARARRGNRAGGTERAQQGGPAGAPKEWAPLRACLRRHGVKRPARGDDRDPAGDLRASLDELRSAVQKCREELPESRQAGGGSAPQPRVEAFRACMGRQGFGPDAEGNTQPGDIRRALARCRRQGLETSAPGK